MKIHIGPHISPRISRGLRTDTQSWRYQPYKLHHIIINYMIIFFITYLYALTSILPIRKHRKCHSDICHRGKTLITRYQASREPHDVTSAQLLIVVWKMSTSSEERFVGVSEAEPSTDIHKFGVCVGI